METAKKYEQQDEIWAELRFSYNLNSEAASLSEIKPRLIGSRSAPTSRLTCSGASPFSRPSGSAAWPEGDCCSDFRCAEATKWRGLSADSTGSSNGASPAVRADPFVTPVSSAVDHALRSAWAADVVRDRPWSCSASPSNARSRSTTCWSSKLPSSADFQRSTACSI